MSFPPKVREDALLSSGRYCCLCHKFCGLKIELHHVVHASEGALTPSRTASHSASSAMQTCAHMTTSTPKVRNTPPRNASATAMLGTPRWLRRQGRAIYQPLRRRRRHLPLADWSSSIRQSDVLCGVQRLRRAFSSQPVGAARCVHRKGPRSISGVLGRRLGGNEGKADTRHRRVHVLHVYSHVAHEQLEVPSRSTRVGGRSAKSICRSDQQAE